MESGETPKSVKTGTAREKAGLARVNTYFRFASGKAPKTAETGWRRSPQSVEVVQ